MHREKELQATIQQLQSRLATLGQELASCQEAHVALRQQCELRGLDVGQGSKAELADTDPAAEVTTRALTPQRAVPSWPRVRNVGAKAPQGNFRACCAARRSD